MSERPQYKEASVLVVDDSEMNLKVAGMVMECFGIRPDCVHSGKECIEHVCDRKYDIIFLDHLMKGMDGIETLGVLKKNSRFHTPVIALTANASEGAEVLYTKAGFDAFMTKPLTLDELEKVLDTYLNVNASSVNRTSEKAAVCDCDEEAASECLNHDIKTRSEAVKYYLEDEGINAAGAIATIGNDEDSYVEIVQMFVDDSETKRTELKEYLDTADVEDYTIVVHSTKSDSLLAGAEKLSAMARQHELAGKEGNIDYITSSWQSLVDEWDRTLAIMNRFLEADSELGH